MKYLLLFLLSLSISSCGVYEPTSNTPTYSEKKTAESLENEEFKALIKRDSLDSKVRTAQALELLLNDNSKSKQVAILINNNSNCNIIVRFAGESYYNMPIKKNDKNYIIIDKGSYSMASNLCTSRFSEYKNILESTKYTISEAK